MVARTESVGLEGGLSMVEEAGDNLKALLAIPSVANAPVVAEKRRELSQIESAMATLAQRYKEKHPKMITARASLAEVQNALTRAVQEQPSVLRNSVEQARLAEQNL